MMSFWTIVASIGFVLIFAGGFVGNTNFRHDRYESHYNSRKKPWLPRIPDWLEDACFLTMVISFFIFLAAIVALIEGAPNPITKNP